MPVGTSGAFAGTFYSVQPSAGHSWRPATPGAAALPRRLAPPHRPLVKDISRPQNADDANENPKRIQHKIGSVALDPGAPGEHDGVGGVENPDEHKRTFRPEPADEAEAENSHQYADQFDGFKVTDNKCIHAGILLHPTGSNHKIHQQLQVLRDAVCCSTSTAASGAGHD